VVNLTLSRPAAPASCVPETNAAATRIPQFPPNMAAAYRSPTICCVTTITNLRLLANHYPPESHGGIAVGLTSLWRFSRRRRSPSKNFYAAERDRSDIVPVRHAFNCIRRSTQKFCVKVASGDRGQAGLDRFHGSGRFRLGFRLPARREQSTRTRAEGRRPKASEEGTRGIAASSWPSMGNWSRGVGSGWFCADWRELKGADDRRLGVASAAEGVTED